MNNYSRLTDLTQTPLASVDAIAIFAYCIGRPDTPIHENNIRVRYDMPKRRYDKGMDQLASLGYVQIIGKRHPNGAFGGYHVALASEELIPKDRRRTRLVAMDDARDGTYYYNVESGEIVDRPVTELVNQLFPTPSADRVPPPSADRVPKQFTYPVCRRGTTPFADGVYLPCGGAPAHARS